MKQLYFTYITKMVFIFPSVARDPEPTVNYNKEFQKMKENSADIIQRLACNKLSNRIAQCMYSKGMIGDSVFESATNQGPSVYEYMRVQSLIKAVLIKTQSNPQCYYDFIEILQTFGIREDAEPALALLPINFEQ